jgi:protein TonB
LHSGIRTPEKIVHVAPLYPSLARASRVQGMVIIEATIDSRGHVESVRILRSVALLDQAALDAVRQWTFTPTLLNGVAVPIIMTVTVNFKLE